MNSLIKIVLLVPLAVLILGCETDDPDYASDIVNTYIVELINESGDITDFKELPLEVRSFVEITTEELFYIFNDDYPCDNNYDTDYYYSFEIDEINESSIIYTDGDIESYTLADGILTITSMGDIIELSEYSATVPPPVWEDTSLLINDIYEPDNTSTLATPIETDGTIQDHYLSLCADEDYFVFSADSGFTYTLETTTETEPELDLILTLYDATGDSLDYSDDINYPENMNPRLSWTCMDSGDYYFAISGYDGWEEFQLGAYAVLVMITEDLSKTSTAIVDKPTKDVQRYRPQNFKFLR